MEGLIGSLDIVLRAAIAMVALFVLTRIQGVKQISQLSFFDYVIGISMGSIAAEMTVNRDLPYHYAVIAMVVFSLTAIGISVWTVKSMWARRIFIGTPILLINNGKILETNLKKAKLDINELLGECRAQGYFNIADIKFAVMETMGQISLLPKDDKRNATCADLGLKPKNEGLVANVIIDGKIMERNLKAQGKNEAWLRRELAKQCCGQLSEIILATVDADGALSVYFKNGETARTTVFD